MSRRMSRKPKDSGGIPWCFVVVETQKVEGMRFAPTIFAKLLEPIDRRRFGAIVARHDGDAYDKSFFRTIWRR